MTYEERLADIGRELDAELQTIEDDLLSQATRLTAITDRVLTLEQQDPDPDPDDGDDAYAALAIDLGAVTAYTTSDGSTLFDEGPHALHGDLLGAAWNPSGGPGENLPGHLTLNGHGHVNCGTAPQLTFSGPHTIVWWERSSGGQERWAQRFARGNDHLHVRTEKAREHQLSYYLRAFSSDRHGAAITADDALRASAWQMLAATYDGQTMRLLDITRDGVTELASTEYDGGADPAPDEAFTIGARSVGGAIDRHWRGSLAGVLTFDRALDDDDLLALRTAATPRAAPAPEPGPAPDLGDLSLRAAPTFDIHALDDSTVDQYGGTLRGWYQLMLDNMGMQDSHFNRNSWRPWNRTGKQHIIAMLAVMRHTKDLALLDESARLVKLALSARRWIDSHWTWEGYDQAIDALLGGGLLATVMYACHVNRDLASPAGHDYGQLADEIKEWLITDYLPRWDTTGRVYFQTRHQQHTYAAAHSVLWYLSKMPGAQYLDRSPAELRQAVHDYVADKLAGDRLGPIGRNGRTVRLWSHTVHHRASATSSGRHLQFSTYTGGEITLYHDFYLEGIPGFDREFFTTMAAALADFVCDDAKGGADTPFARSVAGDLMDPNFDCSNPGGRDTDIRVLGLPYDHCYRSRMPYHRPPSNSTHLLSAWDQDNRMGPYIFEQYERSRRNRSRYHGFPACQAFNLLHHGAA